MDRSSNEIRLSLNAKAVKVKRSLTLGSNKNERLNRSTVTSFYHIDNKKKRML